MIEVRQNNDAVGDWIECHPPVRLAPTVDTMKNITEKDIQHGYYYNWHHPVTFNATAFLLSQVGAFWFIEAWLAPLPLVVALTCFSHRRNFPQALR